MARKSETASTLAQPQATEDQVLAFLRANPSFLAKHIDIVRQIVPPSRFEAGPVVDMQHFVIERLSDELDTMRGCAEHLISTSRNNMSIQSRVHEAVLAALSADGMEGLARAVNEDFPALLDLDSATLGFEPGDGVARVIPRISSLPNGLVESLLGAGDVMLRSAGVADPLVFGESAGLVKSFALVRVDVEGLPVGLLALGSRIERTFHAAQGTDLLAFVGDVVEDCVRRWWPRD